MLTCAMLTFAGGLRSTNPAQSSDTLFAVCAGAGQA
jgi:hypothetical protein